MVQKDSEASAAQSRSRLLQAKEARKLVEQDAQLLANRIALLKVRCARTGDSEVASTRLARTATVHHEVMLRFWSTSLVGVMRMPQAEEERAWKKIQQTKKRAEEITKLREENEERVRERERFRQEQLEESRAVREARAHPKKDGSRSVRVSSWRLTTRAAEFLWTCHARDGLVYSCRVVNRSEPRRKRFVPKQRMQQR